MQDAEYDEGYIRELNEKAVAIIGPLLPDDAEERVQQAYDQAKSIVRQRIRRETGLSLKHGDRQQTIPVRIIDGFPVPLAKMISNFPDRVLWRLILGKPRLGAIIDGLDYLINAWKEFESWEKLPDVARDGGTPLRITREIAAALHDMENARTVVDQIRGIDSDIFGVYAYRLSTSGQSRCELYWMAIAFWVFRLFRG